MVDEKELKIILDTVKALSQEINELKIEKIKREMAVRPSSSAELDKLFTALAKAQGEFDSAAKTRIHSHYKEKYADLAHIIEAARPSLSKNGLSVVQQIITDAEGRNFMDTKLGHSSGQWLGSFVRICPLRKDIQAFGSESTYVQKYTFAPLIGVVKGDDDDDGEAAMTEAREEEVKGTSLKARYSMKNDTPHETINKTEIAEIEYELKEYPEIADSLFDKLNIRSLSEISRKNYRLIIERIRENKLARNGK